MMHHRNFTSGDFIFKNRAPGEGMYIIMRGSIKLLSVHDQEMRIF